VPTGEDGVEAWTTARKEDDHLRVTDEGVEVGDESVEVKGDEVEVKGDGVEVWDANSFSAGRANSEQAR
jgi:hypothetical protein